MQAGLSPDGFQWSCFARLSSLRTGISQQETRLPEWKSGVPSSFHLLRSHLSLRPGDQDQREAMSMARPEMLLPMLALYGCSRAGNTFIRASRGPAQTEVLTAPNIHCVSENILARRKEAQFNRVWSNGPRAINAH